MTFIVPAFALTWGSILLAEPVGVGLAVGFGLILLSLLLVLGIVPPVRLRLAGRAARAVRAAAALMPSAAGR